ncbi:MAG: glycosyltransferase family 4 protein [Bacteroidia bacterium]|nr:glycosyltransferase family 4 protein [Bacteroidia bacterium]
MKYKILTLGWEFPPRINGGLGVACLGLTRALSEYVDISMIIPRSDPRFSEQNINLVGANEVDVEKLVSQTKKIHPSILSKVRMDYADVSLSGYEQPKLYFTRKKTAAPVLVVERPVKDNVIGMPRRFRISEFYGSDLFTRISEFTEIASRLSRNMSFDLIHAHDWMTFLAGLEIKAVSGKPLVLHVHSLNYDRKGPEKEGYVYELEKHAMQQADMIMPVSDYTAEVIENFYEIDPQKIWVVPNGQEKRESYRRKPAFSEKLVVFVGRLVAQKGPEYFLEMARSVLKQYDQVRFAIAGQGEKMPELIKTVAKARLGDRIHFTGFLSEKDTRKLLAMADILVMPSVSEPFGLVATEAVQMGVACVISRQSGVAASLPHALTVDYHDIEKMTSHVLSLLQDSDLHRKIVTETQKDLENISWELSARKAVAGFQKILEV